MASREQVIAYPWNRNRFQVRWERLKKSGGDRQFAVGFGVRRAALGSHYDWAEGDQVYVHFLDHFWELWLDLGFWRLSFARHLCRVVSEEIFTRPLTPS